MECMVVRDEMMPVLYGEADTATQRRVLEHEAVCTACREEMASLRGLRQTLGTWRVPEFGRTRPFRPSWGALRDLAAAAALFVSLGVAAGFAFRLGRGTAETEMRALLAAQEERHEEQIRALRASVAPSTPRTAAPDEAAILGKVGELIRQSEARQAVVWNTTLADFGESSEARRRYDLARVSAGLSYLEGKSGQQTARTTELVGYVLQASQQR